MSDSFVDANPPMAAMGNRVLNKVATLWFGVAVIGQWWMVYYLFGHYGAEALSGNFKPFESVQNTPLSMAFLFSHILLGAIIMIGGPLQLIPQVRQRAPKFHRINGRIFTVSVAIATLFGLYLIWAYDKMPGGNAMLLSMNMLVFIIFTCMYFAIKNAMSRNIKEHRKWALRLFMAINAGWFFRVGLMAWLMIHQKPVGFDPETFEGPFVIVLSFAQYLIPLALLEWYLRVKEGGSESAKLWCSAVMVSMTILMGVGIVGAGMTMWNLGS